MYPLFEGGDSIGFGFLFGVRNYDGWEPIAASRGLPEDVSAELRQEYTHAHPSGAADGAPSWAEEGQLSPTRFHLSQPGMAMSCQQALAEAPGVPPRNTADQHRRYGQIEVDHLNHRL